MSDFYRYLWNVSKCCKCLSRYLLWNLLDISQTCIFVFVGFAIMVSNRFFRVTESIQSTKKSEKECKWKFAALTSFQAFWSILSKNRIFIFLLIKSWRRSLNELFNEEVRSWKFDFVWIMNLKWNILKFYTRFEKLQDFLQKLENVDFECFEEISSWESVEMNL